MKTFYLITVLLFLQQFCFCQLDLNCNTEVNKAECNYIRNSEFKTLTTNSSCYSLTANDWISVTGTPDYSPSYGIVPNNMPLSGANYAYMINSVSTFQTPMPFINNIYSESVGQRIHKLKRGREYLFSFYLGVANMNWYLANQCNYPNAPWTNFSSANHIQRFNVVLGKCSDLYINSDNMPSFKVPHFQNIFCINNFEASSNWEQFAVKFTAAEDDYDFILFYPEFSYPPTSGTSNDGFFAANGRYYQIASIMNPQLIETSDLVINNTLLGDCNLRLTLPCLLSNSAIEWLDNSGSILSNNDALDIQMDSHNSQYFANIKYPNANFQYNSCWEIEGEFNNQLEYSMLNNSNSSLDINGTIEYEALMDGININSGVNVIDISSNKFCNSNFIRICKFVDEGSFSLNLNSNFFGGNQWTFFCEGGQVTNVPSVSDKIYLLSSNTGFTDDNFSGIFSLKNFTAPLTLEVRLENSISHQIYVMKIVFLPQTEIHLNSCNLLSNNWVSCNFETLYSNNNTSYVWDFSANPSFVFNQTSTFSPNFTYDISSIGGDFIASVKTSSSDYECERMRYFMISKDFLNSYLFSRSSKNLKTKTNAYSVKVFPNPILNFVNIESRQNLKSVEIFSADYRILKKIGPLNSGNTSIDVSSFARGVYLLKIVLEDKTVEVKKIIK